MGGNSIDFLWKKQTPEGKLICLQTSNWQLMMNAIGAWNDLQAI